jgi:V8-like Glu-specific endopeptidase
MDPDAWIERLRTAVDELDEDQVSLLCDWLADTWPRKGTTFGPRKARTVLSLLRRRRYFGEMCRAGEAFVSNATADARVRRLYAQALIDTGDFSRARNLLDEVVQDPASSPAEIAEASGLIGRTFKQMYVDHPDASLGERRSLVGSAIEAYHRIYRVDREQYLWHGVNVVALLARAQRDGVPVPIDDEYRTLAKGLLHAVEAREEDSLATIFDYATAMEASVALDDAEAALAWAEKYVRIGLTGPADQFEFGSTLRQIQEVWDPAPDHFAARSIVPLLQSALLDVAVRGTEGGSASLPTRGISQLHTDENFSRLERVFGPDAYMRIKWLQMALDRCRNIGLVTQRDGRGVGTGFVVNGRSLSERLDDDWYFLTNSHVVTDDEKVLTRAPVDRRPLKPAEAFITFELLFESEPREYRVEPEVVWTSPPEALDATLLRLNEPFYDNVECYPVNQELPDPNAKPRIYIAGHPGGRSLTVSLHDNHLLEFDERLIRYRTPTDPGSSGSPVFNDQWELVGLHHAGSEKKESLRNPGSTHAANEGMRIGALMQQIQASYEAR